MLIDSNSEAPLKYTDPTYQALLFVRANIYDLSGGSPALEDTVDLALIDNGVYQGKYQFTAGKPYLVQKLVYTDGTYTSVDQNFAQDNDDFQCVDLQSGGASSTFIGATSMKLKTIKNTLKLEPQPKNSFEIKILKETV